VTNSRVLVSEALFEHMNMRDMAYAPGAEGKKERAN
jgi:PHD/YefM family antitoxin component YafN of YafNO toxin-antitoxin module